MENGSFNRQTSPFLLLLYLQENREREAKEVAQCRRIQELEEQKRHSWAGGEKVGGYTSNSNQEHTMSRLTTPMPLIGWRNVWPTLQQ